MVGWAVEPSSTLLVDFSPQVNLSIFLGVAFSLIMDRLHIDPVNGAAPLLATVSDLIGILLLCIISAGLFRAEIHAWFHPT